VATGSESEARPGGRSKRQSSTNARLKILELDQSDHEEERKKRKKKITPSNRPSLILSSSDTEKPRKVVRRRRSSMKNKNLPDSSSDEEGELPSRGSRGKRPPKPQRAKRKEEFPMVSPMSSDDWSRRKSVRSSESDIERTTSVPTSAPPLIDESPPKLDVEGNVVQDKKKTDTLRRLFSVGGKGGKGKGGKGGVHGGKGKGVAGIVVECEPERSDREEPMKMPSPVKQQTKEYVESIAYESKKQRSSEKKSKRSEKKRRKSEEQAAAAAAAASANAASSTNTIAPALLSSKGRSPVVCRIPLSRISFPFKKLTSEEIRTNAGMANTRQLEKWVLERLSVMDRIVKRTDDNRAEKPQHRDRPSPNSDDENDCDNDSRANVTKPNKNSSELNSSKNDKADLNQTKDHKSKKRKGEKSKHRDRERRKDNDGSSSSASAAILTPAQPPQDPQLRISASPKVENKLKRRLSDEWRSSSQECGIPRKKMSPLPTTPTKSKSSKGEKQSPGSSSGNKKDRRSVRVESDGSSRKRSRPADREATSRDRSASRSSVSTDVSVSLSDNAIKSRDVLNVHKHKKRKSSDDRHPPKSSPVSSKFFNLSYSATGNHHRFCPENIIPTCSYLNKQNKL